MREYELTFIVEPNVTEDGVTDVVEQVSGYFKNHGGEVAFVDVWGRRTLAYPIKDYREGSYVLLEATVPAAALTEIERSLKLNEPIIRYLLVKKDE